MPTAPTRAALDSAVVRRRLRSAGVLVCVALWAVLVPSTPSSAAPEAAASATLDAALRNRLDLALDESFAASGLPGVTVGLWIPGEGEWVATRGVSDIATGTPMDRANQAPIGSVSKTFASTVALQVIGEGTAGLTLDSTIDRWYPDVPEASSITVRMLLNMSSGIPAGPIGSQLDTICTDPQRNWWTPDEQIAIAAAQPRSFPPGEGFEYSNDGILILGRILEKVTGTDYSTLVTTRILEPLGMSRSRFSPDGTLAVPFSHGYSGLCPPGTLADTSDWNLNWAWAAGAMVSTIDDLHTWGRTLADGYRLSPEMSAARVDDLTAWKVGGAFPAGSSYGLGAFVEKDPTTGCVVSVGHPGDVMGYSADVVAYPSTGAVFALMDNAYLPIDVSARMNIQDALRAVYQPAAIVPSTAPCDAPAPTTTTTSSLVATRPDPADAVVVTPAFTG